MSILIPIADQASPQKVLQTPVVVVSTDWFGDALSTPIEFFLAATSTSIFFAGGARLPHEARHSAGSFVEGLWEGNVFECFLWRTDGSYLELNLSPDAAWWGCSFSKYRTRSKILTDVIPRRVGLHENKPYIELDRQALGLVTTDASLPQLEGVSFAAIWQIGDEKKYFTSGVPSFAPPDFHRSELQTPLRLSQRSE